MKMHRWMVPLALAAGVALMPSAAARADESAPAPAAQERRNAGDTRRVDFVLPFEAALAKAKAENRMLFIKPIYGGVDPDGAKDYRCGSW